MLNCNYFLHILPTGSKQSILCYHPLFNIHERTELRVARWCKFGSEWTQHFGSYRRLTSNRCNHFVCSHITNSPIHSLVIPMFFFVCIYKSHSIWTIKLWNKKKTRIVSLIHWKWNCTISPSSNGVQSNFLMVNTFRKTVVNIPNTAHTSRRTEPLKFTISKHVNWNRLLSIDAVRSLVVQ